MIFVATVWIIGILIWIAALLRRFGLPPIRPYFSLFGFVILICGSVFGYDLFHIPAPIPVTSDRALLAFVVVVFTILVLRRKQKINNPVMLDVTFLALIAVILGSVVVHDYGYSNNRPISRFLFFYLMPLALYVVVRNSISTKNEMKLILFGMTAFGCYLSITGIAEVKGISAAVFPKYILNPEVVEFLGRARGPFLNPISNGIFLTTSLACAVVLFWQSDFKLKVGLGAASILIAIGNIATLTRSVWMGMVVGVGIVIVTVTNRRQKAVMMIAGTVASLVLFASFGDSLVNFKRDKHVTRNEMSKSAELRPIFASIAWKMFLDRPAFGHGFGQYGRAKIDYLNDPSSKLELSKAKAYLQHNVFLSLLTEVGIVGCGILAMLLIRSYQIAIQVLRFDKSTSTHRMYALVLIAALSSYVCNGMFHDTSIIPMANMLLFFLIAIVVRSHQELGLATEVLQLSQSNQTDFSVTATSSAIAPTG